MDTRRTRPTSTAQFQTTAVCEQLLRPDDVARVLNIGKRTLERWLSSGRFPRPDIQVGPKICLWRPSTVQRWIEAETTKPR
jgi:excisionase family DNA binding protein